MDKRERGIDYLGKSLAAGEGDSLREHLDGADFGKECASWAADFAYGMVWSREGLDPRSRSCVVIGILMALRQTEELKHHVRMALANGISRTELEEILYLAVPYAGFPAANTAKWAMKEALAAIDAAERGD
ncbi:carboxymuconolactone decarboxylase family protein [Novosphingobium sp. BL-8A]|uniref:carboxymuconolactone decarboxylase family protein n=1 Tax=Novosphingobium sp. BL-8A TaxID=3127639 RepID=UPI0037575271